MIETLQRQHDRMLKSILAALGSGGDGSVELPEGVTLPAKSLQELLNIEKKIEDGEHFQRLVCTRHYVLSAINLSCYRLFSPGCSCLVVAWILYILVMMFAKSIL